VASMRERKKTIVFPRLGPTSRWRYRNGTWAGLRSAGYWVELVGCADR
jgi:hypothetical protein